MIITNDAYLLYILFFRRPTQANTIKLFKSSLKYIIEGNRRKCTEQCESRQSLKVLNIISLPIKKKKIRKTVNFSIKYTVFSVFVFKNYTSTSLIFHEVGIMVAQRKREQKIN